LGPPPAPDIGFDGTPREAREEALDAARRLREAHVRMILGPSADLAVGGGPAEARAFSDDPREAARFVEAAVSGWKEANVAVAPGRFPGEGGASQDPLFGAATVGLSVDELSARDVEPFRAAVRAGTDAIQMSAALYAAWDGVTPATVLPDAVRFLRSSTGFDGAVVSADLNAATGATGGGVARAAVEAINAGCDLLVVAGGPAEQEAAYRAVLGAVRRREIARGRFLEALRRVAAVKKATEAR
ncbi:MAG TPA: glycoside hydrolase family 3 N-terminal domain-containing protein, partial [Solirubrobacteraceae bacterium]|nr:glycoside hydrolase family 3 N-terminal domain-containing protein [Solirubrobacteraceae bacterium]